MRKILLDTETTGLSPKQGHRIIEIGCVELIDRELTGNDFHQYINPERAVDRGAFEVHGIGDDFLADKPVFADVADAFMDYVRDAEVIIHNAPFDVGFLDHELTLASKALGKKFGTLKQHVTIFDTLELARRRHPGQRNNLDALCRRYDIVTQRDLHGALLDAQILADVYLAMTGGQVSLSLDEAPTQTASQRKAARAQSAGKVSLPVIHATEAELAAHASRLDDIDKASDGNCVWKQTESA